MTTHLGKTAIITGASSGIGRASAKALAKAGFAEFGTSSKAGGTSVAGITMLACDVTDAKSVGELVSKVLSMTGRIDLPLNCHPAAIRAVAVSVTP